MHSPAEKLPPLGSIILNIMLLLIGIIVVIGSVVIGLYLGGSSPVVLLHITEFVIVLGICLGILIIASPVHVLKGILHKTLIAIKGGSQKKSDYLDLMKMLYQLFVLARREGIIAVEDHVTQPNQSSIIRQYPSFLKNKASVDFFSNSFRPIMDGKVKPEQLRDVINVEIRVMHEENEEPVRILALVGDSFPGVGICAAVLGIIITMGHVAEGAEAVGYKVAAALTGTFLGVFGAYGFINPLTALIETNNAAQQKYYQCMATAITSFATGMAPLMAVEMARRELPSNIKPGADELENILRAMPVGNRN